MKRDQDSRQQARGEQLSRTQILRVHEQERHRADVAQQDDGEDWPLLSFLLGGLALALIANTFIGLMPV